MSRIERARRAIVSRIIASGGWRDDQTPGNPTGAAARDHILRRMIQKARTKHLELSAE